MGEIFWCIIESEQSGYSMGQGVLKRVWKGYWGCWCEKYRFIICCKLVIYALNKLLLFQSLGCLLGNDTYRGSFGYFSGQILCHCVYFNYIIYDSLLVIDNFLKYYGEYRAANDDDIYLSMITLENGVCPNRRWIRDVITFLYMI